jgi:hypothetical protein
MRTGMTGDLTNADAFFIKKKNKKTVRYRTLKT